MLTDKALSQLKEKDEKSYKNHEVLFLDIKGAFDNTSSA